MAFSKYTMLYLYALCVFLPLMASAGPARPKVSHPGSIPYGAIIDHCHVPGTVALTFDDGPHIYTRHILDLLDRYAARATFFVNGDNFGRGFINDHSTPWPDTLLRMLQTGHQVGSHTWDHYADLSHATPYERREEMERLETALAEVMGFYPTYMRPPYGSCEAACQEDLGEMGYHVVNWDVDTKDYAHNDPDSIRDAEDIFAAAVTGDPSTSSYLVLSHDVHQNTAYSLVEFMLQTLYDKGFKAVTVGECLGDEPYNWYRRDEGQQITHK